MTRSRRGRFRDTSKLEGGRHNATDTQGPSEDPDLEPTSLHECVKVAYWIKAISQTPLSEQASMKMDFELIQVHFASSS